MCRDIMEEMLGFVESNISEDLSLKIISDRCGISPYYCSFLFHKNFGETMRSYIKKRRLFLAAEELKNTDERIIDIAIKYGYSSQESFSRAFAENLGVTPKRFRTCPMPLCDYIKGNKRERGLFMDSMEVNNIQDRIKENHDVKILNILSGECMAEEFRKKNCMKEDAVYVPFNEAMCWGKACDNIFSDEFVKIRAASLKSSEDEYRKIVMEPLKPLFNDKFDVIVLWLGDDMFCQMNLITILGYLDQTGFDGDVLFCMKYEQKDKMLKDAIELSLHGYKEIFESIICRNMEYKGKLMPVTYQAMKLYLGCYKEDGEIMQYIKNNICKEGLIPKLMKLFPQYGLGSLQYKWMIESARK